jgi:hypothetical protein
LTVAHETECHTTCHSTLQGRDPPQSIGFSHSVLSLSSVIYWSIRVFATVLSTFRRSIPLEFPKTCDVKALIPAVLKMFPFHCDRTEICIARTTRKKINQTRRTKHITTQNREISRDEVDFVRFTARGEETMCTSVFYTGTVARTDF